MPNDEYAHFGSYPKPSKQHFPFYITQGLNCQALVAKVPSDKMWREPSGTDDTVELGAARYAYEHLDLAASILFVVDAMVALMARWYGAFVL